MPLLLLLDATVVGAVIASLYALWLRRRDQEAAPTLVALKSAALKPLLIALLIALASLWALATGFGETGERSPWLTVYVAAVLGAYVGVPAFIGGLVASLVIVRRSSP